MYNFPGPATNIPPQVGDTLVWNGQLWVPSSSSEEGSVITQTEWAIDFINGDDSADGTPDHPLRTGAEFTRRTWGRGLAEPVTLDLRNDCPNPSEDYLFVNAPSLNAAAFLTIRGTTTEIATATLNNVVNQVPSVSQTTVEADIDLSGFVGRRIRKVSGPSAAPVGTIAWIEASAAGVSTLSAPIFVDTSVPGFWSTVSIEQLANGDVFVVEDLSQIPSFWCRTFGAANFGVGLGGGGLVDVSIGNPALFEDANIERFQVYGCHFRTAGLAMAGVYTGSTRLIGSRFTNLFNSFSLEGSSFLIGNSFAAALNISGGASWPTFFVGNSLRGFPCIVIRSGRLEINNSGTNSGLSIHEWPVTSGIGAALQVQEGCFANLDGKLWGTSTIANTYGIRVDAYAGTTYHAARKPTIAGALAPGKDVEVGGVSLAYAAVPGSSAIATNFAALVAKN